MMTITIIILYDIFTYNLSWLELLLLLVLAYYVRRTSYWIIYFIISYHISYDILLVHFIWRYFILFFVLIIFFTLVSTDTAVWCYQKRLSGDCNTSYCRRSEYECSWLCKIRNFFFCVCVSAVYFMLFDGYSNLITLMSWISNHLCWCR